LRLISYSKHALYQTGINFKGNRKEKGNEKEKEEEGVYSNIIEASSCLFPSFVFFFPLPFFFFLYWHIYWMEQNRSAGRTASSRTVEKRAESLSAPRYMAHGNDGRAIGAALTRQALATRRATDQVV
jgi:hypothetical protein